MASVETKKITAKRGRSSHNLYLGVDGGGTKTHVVLSANKTDIISDGFSGASNPLRVGVETAVSNIVKAVEAACDSANRSRGDIVSATLGLAGVRRADLRQRVRESFIKKLPVKQVEITTDAEIALYGVTLGKAGVVVISGTGSICYGKNNAGKTATAGGWGPIAGDEGSGISIARRALQAIAKASDGRGKPTGLSAAGIEYFRTSTPENLLVAIYSPQMDNAKIAGFARFVIETAKEGDEIAVDILREAGFELGLAASAVLKKLKMDKQKVPVGCVGSIFKAGKPVTDSLLETVRRFAPKVFLVAPVLQPANAAARLAFEMFNKGEKR